MKQLLALLLIFTLTSCLLPGPRFGNPVTDRDWSTFQIPPAGTPVMLKIFSLYGPYDRQVKVIDVPGTWKDENDPFILEFPIWLDIDGIVRIEIHFRGEVISVKNFDPPTMFSKGSSSGWQR